jgi:cytochrome c-type protein NapB
MFGMMNKTWALAAGLAIILALGVGGVMAQQKPGKEIPEEDLGIRKETIYNEETVKPEHGEYSPAAPGSSKKLERAFENSPPLIPHDITGMLPIAIAGNLCVGCHMPDEAKRSGATPIPKSHLMKLTTREDLHGKLDNERYNCMECHVPQVEITPPVKNTFKGGFKGNQGKSRSNLSDTLNEGVSAE